MEWRDWAKEIGFYGDENDDKIRCLVYGETGAGKTLFSATFPKPFYMDANRGGTTVRQLGHHHPNLKLRRGDETYKIVKDVLRRLKKKEEPFDKLEVETLVWDDLTDLADFLAVDLLLHPAPRQKKRSPRYDKLEWDDYGILRNELKEFMAASRELDLNVVAIAGLKTEEAKKGSGWMGKPLILGSFRDYAGYGFDEYYHMMVEGSAEKVKYNTYTVKHRHLGIEYDAKTRTGLPAITQDLNYKTLKKAFFKTPKEEKGG